MSAGHEGVVLVVEDEALVRMTLDDSLTDAGFRVLEAANASEALLILQARTDITTVLTDVEMPGEMNGFELARETRSRWPFMAVFVISGRSRPSTGDLPDGVEFIPKPFPIDMLIDRVRQSIQQR